jgi:hypothetical protein
MDKAKRKQAAGRRRAAKVRSRRQRLTKATARSEQYADRAATLDMLDLLADELEAAIGHTLDERSAEPAWEFAGQLIETDQVTPLDDESAEELGISLSFAVLVGWFGALRAEFDGPALVEDALHWVRSNLDLEAAGRAERAAVLLAHSGDGTDADLELVETLDVDVLPALIWLTAGVVASHGGGDPAWLRRYESH